MDAPEPADALDLVLGAGWHFPIEERGGRLRMSAGERKVRQAIELILSTEKGERAMRPDFGCSLRSLLFAPNTGSTRALAAFEVGEALKAWEPRIELISVAASPGGDRGEAILIEIAYRVRSTDNRFSLVYPLYLERGAG